MAEQKQQGWALPLVTVGTFLAIAVACQPGDEELARDAAASSVVVRAPASPASPAPAADSALSGLGGASSSGRVGVARVVDGDTFVLDDGQSVRVLGIDSCEMGTAGGQDAKDAAEGYLLGTSVTLEAEPGVDRDRYGRLLRYVEPAHKTDFGEFMVGQRHTGVYAGRNDASASRLAALRSADFDGRSCDGNVVDPAPVYVPAPSSEDDHHEAPSRRTGRSGHPCLPGERDGDHDGFCGEGR